MTKRDNDSKNGMPHGDAKLAGAVYAIYKNGIEVDRYTTDDNGQFTTKNYVCDERTAGTDVWTIKEITPSEGYLLDTTVYTLNTDPANFTAELNPLTQSVNEKPIYGWFDILKYKTDTAELTDPEELIPEESAEFYVYLKSNAEDGDTSGKSFSRRTRITAKRGIGRTLVKDRLCAEYGSDRHKGR